MSDTIVKILSWSTEGLCVPDWNIDISDDGTENISLLLMPSGMGKTSTLEMLRYSFFDYSKKITNKQIEKLKPRDSSIKKGKFTLNIKVNDQKIQIQTLYDFESLKISYNTKGNHIPSGFADSLVLTDELKSYINQEYIEKTFFNLELVDNLFQSSDAVDSIRKLYKLYYFDEIKNKLEIYKEKQQAAKGSVKISKKAFEELKLRKKKILEQIKIVEDKYQKDQENHKKLINEEKKLEKEKKEIGLSKTEIREKIKEADENVKLYENELTENYNKFYNFLKNPINLNAKFNKQLVNFEKNLKRLKIPQSVAESFFEDLIKEEKCLCGNHMTDEMINQILKSKENILSEDTWFILNSMKTKINKNLDQPIDTMQNLFGEVASSKRKLNIAERKRIGIESSIDDEKFQKISARLIDVKKEIKNLEDAFKIYNEPASKTDTPSSSSIKKLEALRIDTQKQIDDATDTENLSKKVNILNELMTKAYERTKEEIIQEVIKNINLEIPRVMPYEKIFVKDIKDKIILEKGGASQGQLARIGYLFLITLLNRPNFNFPFVVDSPVTAMDDISRKEIAQTISKDLNNQYIGLLLPTERDHFSDELGSNQNKKIKYITAFSTYDRASEHMVQQANKFGINTNEFKNGVVGYGEDFFNQFSGISKEI